MAKEFLGRGWKFPVAIDVLTGRIATSEYEQDIKEAIRIILATAPLERVMRPDFGCGVHNLVFESMSRATFGLVESRVREALTKYEPRIEISSLTVSSPDPNSGTLLVTIQYVVRETNNEFNLVYPFFLTEGTNP